MDPQDRVPSWRCPNCGIGNRLMRAKHVVGDDSGGACAAHALSPECPAGLLWSVFLYAAIGCALLASMVAGINPDLSLPRHLEVVLAAAVTGAVLTGALGLRNTRRNRALACALEPAVRAVHDHAVYCSACACVYFNDGELPTGLEPFEAIPAAEYRWRLWQACGFTRRA